jgi:flagellar FliL protein
MGKLIPLLMAVAGLGAGVGAGLVLKPVPPDDGGLAAAAAPPPEPGAREFVPLTGQFVVPVIRDGQVRALVILTLSLETAPASVMTVNSAGPKLRDVFLRVLFDHANAGGFDGAFTAAAAMAPLRNALTEAAQSVLGSAVVHNVLIVDLVRQDV